MWRAPSAGEPGVAAAVGAVGAAAAGADVVALQTDIAPQPVPVGPSRRRRRGPDAPTRLGVLSARRLDRRAISLNIRRIGKLEPGFGTWRRLRSLIVLIVIVALIAVAFAAALDIIVSIISVFANHAISKSAGS
jgi:hypothetical protein